MRAAVDVSLRHAKRKEQNKKPFARVATLPAEAEGPRPLSCPKGSLSNNCTVPSILFHSQHNRGPLLLLLLLLCTSQPEGPVRVGGGVFLLHGALGAVLAPIDGAFPQAPLSPCFIISLTRDTSMFL